MSKRAYEFRYEPEFNNKLLIGACSESKTPDDWFPQFPLGNVGRKKMANLALKVAQTIDICNGCSVRDECLEQGMSKGDMSYGIWGGVMAGDRLQNAGYVYEDFSRDSSEASEINFTRRIREEWYHSAI